MRLITFSVATPLGEMQRVGALLDGRAVDLSAVYAEMLARDGVHAAQEVAQAIIPPDMVAFIERWPLGRDVAGRALAFARDVDARAANRFGARMCYAAEDYRLRVPLRPRRIKDYLVYEAHKKKAMERRGLPMPELWYRMPTYTNRNILGLADPGQDVVWPGYSQKLDFEFEIGVVIAKAGKNIRPEDASAHIAGFTIFNDFSARDIQADEGKIGAGAGKSKDFDFGNVLGPCIATPDEIDAMSIEMILRVDGEEWSRGSTRGMKFSWGQIIENASREETIFPGDVFASGTMDGGCCVELERWFKAGAVIEMEARGIGVLRNRVVAAPGR